MAEDIEKIIDGAPDYLQDALRKMATGEGYVKTNPATMGEIRSMEYEPNDGFVYRASACPIPFRGFEGGGNVEDYMILTIWSPSYNPTGITYVTETNGYLAEHYIAEKFDPQGKMNDFELGAVVHLARAMQLGDGTPKPKTVFQVITEYIDEKDKENE